jgi:hypothetical protein
MERNRLKRVRDYRQEAEQVELAAFTRLYPHPFLVQTRGLQQVDEWEFATAGVLSVDALELDAIASGRMLNPDFVVHSVVKRKGGLPPGPGMLFTVGRAGNCDVVIPTSAVSKFHCYLKTAANDSQLFFLVDGGSRNGTQVDGKTVPPNDSVQLASGSDVVFGAAAAFKFFAPEDFYEQLRSEP